MPTTHADLTDGTRVDIEATLITRRPVQTAHGKVHRLIVADRTGTQFPALITPNTDSHHDLKTGATYHITGLAGATPPGDDAQTDHDCPECGGCLRTGQQFDAIGPSVTEAVARLAFDVPFGVIDATSAVRKVTDDTGGVDDWTHLQEPGRRGPPALVCTDCDRHCTLPEVHPDTTHPEADGEFQMGEMLNNQVDASPAAPETVGLAAGGAKDIANFRENIAEGYTPKPGAITEEGLFYDYYFETGDAPDTDALFAPRYATASSTHPLTEETETYLSVGLDSTLSVEDFERPPLELVVTLDISGPMNSVFDQYYYDEHGQRRSTDADDTTKIDAATQSICALTEQLRPSDKLGVVLFNSTAHIAKPLRDVASTDMRAIRRHIRDIAAGGGTNLSDGFDAATELLQDSPADPSVERRIVFMTDMMPNVGATEETELERRFSEAAVDGIHTTFVGMGLDENADLVESLSGIRGANHYFVTSAEEFERRLGDEFDYMVTPLVYDLTLELDVNGYEIEAVHGSPSADEDSGRLVHVGTLFPSAKADGEARGGVILVRLRRTGDDPEIDLVASWSERNGGTHTEEATVDMPEAPESFDHDGVRKAVALSRYARALRAWAADVHDGDTHAVRHTRQEELLDDWVIGDERGQHEHGSTALVVPKLHAERFNQLQDYLAEERTAVGNGELEQEIELLETLCQQSTWQPGEVPE